MTALIKLAYCWSTLLALWGAHERQNLVRLVDASQNIAVGATPDNVTLLLGAPKMEWEKWGALPSLLFGHRPKQWIYGTTIDLKWIIVPEAGIPNPIPIKLRLFFIADEDDLVIDWDSDNKVSAVHRPNLRLRAR